jgi:hypothetical protein
MARDDVENALLGEHMRFEDVRPTADHGAAAIRASWSLFFFLVAFPTTTNSLVRSSVL